MGATLQEEWKRYFVAYEDALASFYSLQEATEQTLEQSRAAAIELNRIAGLRMSIGDVKRRLQASADNDRVAEIERDRATVELDGVGVDVLDLVATRGAALWQRARAQLPHRSEVSASARRPDQAGSCQVSLR